MPRTRPEACAVLKRSSHRGWLLVNAPVEQVISIYPGPFAVAKLEALGVPLKFYWPAYGDFEGAKLLIDAVMACDLAAIGRLNARYPEFDFQLGEWFDALRAEAVKAASIMRRTLTSKVLAHGLRMDAELETDTDTGVRTVVQCIYRGRKQLARKVLASDSPAVVREEAAYAARRRTAPVDVEASDHPEPETLVVHPSLTPAVPQAPTPKRARKAATSEKV